MRRILVLVITVLISASTPLAQNNKEVVPPPNPIDLGASLDDTIKSIQNDLSAQGKFSYFRVEGEPHVNASQEFDYTANCKVSFKISGRVLEDTHYKNLKGSNWDEETRAEVCLGNLRTIGILHDQPKGAYPNSFAIFATFSEGTAPPTHYRRVFYSRRHDNSEETTTTDKLTPPLIFLDEDRAKRVAKALQHAMDLCGGGKPDEPDEPFWPFPL